MLKTKKYLGIALNVICWLYIVLIALILPFYFTNGYGYIGSDKANFFKKFGFPVLIAGLVGLIFYAVFDAAERYRQSKKADFLQWLKSKFSVSDICILVYIVIEFISYLSTQYKDIAWYGHEKWPTGFVPHFMVVTSFFLFSRFFKGENYFFEILRKVMYVVFILAILDRFEVRPLKMEYATYFFISTIGNINWFCGYWSIVAWIVVGAYWLQPVRGDGKNKWELIFGGILSALTLFTGIIQGSDSGAFAIAMVVIVMFCMSVENGDRMQRLFELAIMLCGTCAVATIVNLIFPTALSFPSFILSLTMRSVFPWVAGLSCALVYYFIKKQNRVNQFPKKIWKKVRPVIVIGIAAGFGLYFLLTLVNTLLPEGFGPFAGKGAFTFDIEWASKRGGTWAAAFRTWWDQNIWHKLFGVGPDSMWPYINSGENPVLKEAVTKQFPKQRLLNAHNEWLTNLANVGLLGAAAFAGFMVSYIYRFFKAGKERPELYIFAFVVLSYTVNNIFSFQTTMNLTYIFMVMGVGERMLRRQEGKKNDKKRK